MEQHERLAIFFERLGALPASRSPEEALALVCRLKYSPTLGAGVSQIDEHTTPFDAGHDHVFESIELAAECLLDLVRASSSQPQTHAA